MALERLADEDYFGPAPDPSIELNYETEQWERPSEVLVMDSDEEEEA